MLAAVEECINGGIETVDASSAPMLIYITGAIGILFSVFLLKSVASVNLDVNFWTKAPTTAASKEQNGKLVELYEAISLGAGSFLNAEYRLCALFVILVFPSMSALIAWGAKEGESWAWGHGTMSGISFIVGAVTSMISGFIGMRVAVFSNARCTVGACSSGSTGWKQSFNTAFRAGGVMGFSLTGIALLSLYVLLCILKCAPARRLAHLLAPPYAALPHTHGESPSLRA